jgi:flagellar biosynthesis regulator FlaF
MLAGEAMGTNQADPAERAQQARAAVAAAKEAVEAAAQKRALWTSAQDALKHAEQALAQRDYAGAERLAKFAAEQAKLGIEQLGYPHFQ